MKGDKKKKKQVVFPNKGEAAQEQRQTREEFFESRISNYAEWISLRGESKFFVKSTDDRKRTYTAFDSVNKYVMTKVMSGIPVKINAGVHSFTMKLTPKK